MSEQKSFWTTMPGMLTGIASLLTAIAGLFTAIHKPSAAPQAPAVAMIAPTQSVKHQGCEKAIGNWSWFIGGVVTFEKDGNLSWRKDPKDVFPTATGTWNCIDAKEQEMTLLWHPTGIVDTVNISADGRSIAGTNYTGIKVTGTKR